MVKKVLQKKYLNTMLYKDSFGVIDLENPIKNHVGEIKEDL